MKNFELKIIRPTKTEIFQVEWIRVKTLTGNFFVGPEHDDLITILKEKSPFLYKKANNTKEESLELSSGFLKIKKGKAFLVLDI